MKVQAPTRSVNGNRYQLKSRTDSPQQQTPTPPRSPMKALPTAPDPITRVAASQKYIKTSVSRSPLPSPFLNQETMEHDKLATRDEYALRAKSPNQTVPSQSPEPTRPSKNQKPSLATKISQTFRPLRSPEPPRSTDSPEPKRARIGSDAERRVKSPEPGRSAISPGPASAAMNPESLRATRNQNLSIPRDSPEPVRSVHSPSPVPGDYWVEEATAFEDRARSPNPANSSRTPVQIKAQMNGQSESPIPERAPSRRTSLTKRTRDFLRKKPSFTREQDADSLSAVNLPIQSPSAEHTPAKRPASPVTTTIVRRTSSRTAKAMSMSTYSASPISPTDSSETPPVREASPILIRNGKPVPAQSSYGVLSLQPMRAMSPLEHPAMTLDAAKEQASNVPGKNTIPLTSITRTRNNSDNTEGIVNSNHPLLQTARHTRYARNTNGDLPLRHYHSQGAFTHSNPDLTHGRSDEMRPPKRSSSLFYNPKTRLVASPEPNRSRFATPTQNSRPQNQMSQSPLAIAHVTSENIASAESELGVHPAHRTHDPASASTAVSSPSFSTGSSLTEQGATPPPIATTREPQQTNPGAASPTMSPPSRFAPLPPSQLQKQPQVTTEAVSEHDWQPHHQPQRSIDSSSSPLVLNDPKSKTTATSNTPVYLNPASSSALIEFLASTPPQSPPHPGTKLNRDLTHSPALPSPTGVFFNRPFIPNGYQDGQASPPPPAPGSRSMIHLGRVNSGDLQSEKAKKGWKKMFGVGKSAKKTNLFNGGKSVNGKKKKIDISKGCDANNAMLNEVDAGPKGINPTDMRSDGGFVGMGPDGNWISRKNFVKK